jgi:hypothetical protein
MGLEKENVFESVQKIIFKPLNAFLQNMDPSYKEFLYFNERFDLLVISHSDYFLIKLFLENTESEKESYDGIKIVIFDKKRQSKIDEQTIFFTEKIKIIETNRDKTKSLVTELDVSDSLSKIVEYIEQWKIYLNDND